MCYLTLARGVEKAVPMLGPDFELRNSEMRKDLRKALPRVMAAKVVPLVVPCLVIAPQAVGNPSVLVACSGGPRVAKGLETTDGDAMRN